MKLLKLDTTWIEAELINILEEIFMNNEEIWEYEIEENWFIVFVNNAEWFKDYLNEGKVIKAWLLDNKIISDAKDNTRFSLIDMQEETNEQTVNVSDLDKKLVKVSDDDAKVQDILLQLKQKWK